MTEVIKVADDSIFCPIPLAISWQWGRATRQPGRKISSDAGAHRIAVVKVVEGPVGRNYSQSGWKVLARVGRTQPS